MLAHTPLAACLSLRESNISEHPRQIEYNIQDHEDVMNVMVVAGCYVDPASASQGSQYADYRQGGGKSRRRKRLTIEYITKGNESEARP
jgi:hypothetical protein